jgi:hypothetical protein
MLSGDHIQNPTGSRNNEAKTAFRVGLSPPHLYDVFPKARAISSFAAKLRRGERQDMQINAVIMAK